MTALSGNVRPHDSAVNGLMVDGVGTTGVWAPDVATTRMRARAAATRVRFSVRALVRIHVRLGEAAAYPARS